MTTNKPDGKTIPIPVTEALLPADIGDHSRLVEVNPISKADPQIAMQSEVRETREELERLNTLAREFGYGQGELDDDLAGCLRKSFDAMKAEIERLKRHQVEDDNEIELALAKAMGCELDRYGYCNDERSGHALALEAAELIERLRQENERLKGELAGMKTDQDHYRQLVSMMNRMEADLGKHWQRMSGCRHLNLLVSVEQLVAALTAATQRAEAAEAKVAAYEAALDAGDLVAMARSDSASGPPYKIPIYRVAQSEAQP